MITACIICATLLQSLDQTIANVALPYMQGSFSASYDEITWVLTAYITAAAIMTAPVGWLAARFGRKRLFVRASSASPSPRCCAARRNRWNRSSLFRLMQGVCSAALVPLSQAILFDIYPIEKRGFAMAVWGMGVMIGPILGPTLGGYLTEMLQLALRVLHQPAVRHAGHARTDRVHARVATASAFCASTGWASRCSASASARCK